MRASTLALALLISLPAYAIPNMTRDEIIAIAKSGVGCRYVWGGTCWDPNNKSWKGADCSGYVTKCWQIPSATKTTDCVPHYYTTSTFQNSSTYWGNISRNDLIKGDALVYNSGSAGHIVLYYSGDKWGNAQVYEAKGSAYGIVYGTKYVGSSYVARRRDSIVAPTPTYPLMTIKSSLATISGQDRDFCKQGKSTGIFDWMEGQTTEVTIDVRNSGTEVAKNVKVGIWVEEPYLAILKWNIYTDWKQSGSFVLNDADGMQSFGHDNPGKSFTLNLFSISVGETKQIRLKVKAVRYSIGAADHPDVRAWIASVDGFYSKGSFDAAPSNVKSYQTQNGGDLRTYQQTDVLAKETCDSIDNDCDGQTDEDEVCTKPTVPAPGGEIEAEPEPDPEPTEPVGFQKGPPPDLELSGGCSLAGHATPLPALLVLVALRLLAGRRRQRRP